MKFEFSQLGPIGEGEIEVADLTIICGENNTGKTYVTYSLYCLIKSWKRLVKFDLSKSLVALKENGAVQINLKETVIDNWEVIRKNVLDCFLKELPGMLASKSTLFDKTKFDFSFDLGDSWYKKPFRREFRSFKNELTMTISRAEDSAQIEIAYLNTDTPLMIMERFIVEEIVSMVLSDILPDIFIASAERTGATIFRKKINISQRDFIERMEQLDFFDKVGSFKGKENKIYKNELINMMRQSSRREYAVPVDDNVKYLDQLPSVNTEEGDYYKHNKNLLSFLEEIAGGNYVTNKEGLTHFQPTSTQLKLDIGEVSSSVRSLMIVFYWLKYQAKVGDMLMIDEPELNLHPANQRKLARFIVRLINTGIKVFITTHSDYIVKEINTLIMLNKDSQDLDGIRKKYRYYPEDVLDWNKVALYMVRDRLDDNKATALKTLVRANISSTLGVEALSFDETIDEMNAMQEAIYYGLNLKD
jgi:hypothetical protein